MKWQQQVSSVWFWGPLPYVWYHTVVMASTLQMWVELLKDNLENATTSWTGIFIITFIVIIV